MNWAIPWAPAGETANGLKFDSTINWAASRPAETSQRSAERSIASLNCGGTKSGSASAAWRPSPAADPAMAFAASEHGAGPRAKPKCQGSQEYGPLASGLVLPSFVVELHAAKITSTA